VTEVKSYFVYSTVPESLSNHGDVYYPKIKMSYVILTTDLSYYEIRQLDGVYEVRECETGSLCK